MTIEFMENEEDSPVNGTVKPLNQHNYWQKWRLQWRSQWQCWGRSFLFVGLGLVLALGPHLPVVAQAVSTNSANAASSELRGVWLTNIDSDVLFSEEKIRDAVIRLDRLHFNTVYPTVWNGGYTLYPSKVAEEATGIKIDPNPDLQDRDMLAEVVDLGHKRGLTVIPWFEYGLMAPADSELVRRHPDWVSTRKDGNAIYRKGDKDLVWLTPVHPGVQRLLVDMITEVVEHYDVDGVQLDDHFGMPVEVGYDAYTVGLYQQEHQGRRPPDNPRDPEWMRWRADKVSDMLAKIYAGVKTRKPNCLFSISPNPREFSYKEYLQDWVAWGRLGLVDELIVQVYRNDHGRFLYELNDFNHPDLRRVRQRVPVSIGILTGLRVVNMDIEEITRQVEVTRNRQFSGMAFFFYESLGDRDEAFAGMFPNPATRPSRA